MWIARAMRFADRAHVTDRLRVCLSDCRPLLDRLLAPGSVRAVYVFFPDPWWKKRHEKRRLVSESTLDAFHRILTPGGLFHFRTDVAEYYDRVAALVSADARFVAAPPEHDADGRALPLTDRMSKCQELGIRVQSLAIMKRADAPAAPRGDLP